MNKGMIITILIIILLILGYLLFAGNNNGEEENESADNKLLNVTPETEDSQLQGDAVLDTSEDVFNEIDEAMNFAE